MASPAPARATTVPVALAWQSFGSGDPVLLLPPAATRAEVWNLHQVPALTAAGYRVITANHRGMSPSPVAPGPYRLTDLVEDAAALIEAAGLGRCHVVGSSLGAFVAQELALARPDLVRTATMIGTRARVDLYRKHMARALAVQTRDSAPVTAFDALNHVARLFGPRTLADDRFVADWVEMAQRFPVTGPGPAAQYEATVAQDRRSALAGIIVPCLVIGFGADTITPVTACHEVRDAIAGCEYVQFDGLGHFGFLEDPAAVNAALVTFLAAHAGATPDTSDTTVAR